MKDWSSLASEESIKKTADSLKSENIEVFVLKNGQAAKEKVLELLPKGAEVMTMSSQTLEAAGISKEINESGNYDSVKAKLMKMDRATQGREMQKLGAAPDYAIGSVQAVSEDGHVFVASNTGSQLGAYAFASPHVIWVVGSQKIVKNWDEGVKRVYEYSLPHESERQKSIGNAAGSGIGKLLIFNKEVRPGRVTMIIVKENLGF
jgi:L-lactate utilization protein LutC